MNRFAGIAGFGQQILHAFVQQTADSFEPVDLLLLMTDDLIQGLQQILLIGGLDFELYDPFFVHCVFFK